MKLNKRQSKILEFINSHNSSSRLEIEEFIMQVEDKVSKITILRDLDLMLQNQIIQKIGHGKNIKYISSQQNELLFKYDTDNYFKTNSDERQIKYPQFNFEIFNNLKNLFTKEELKEIQKINDIYTNKVNNISEKILKKEYERLLIELSWKSSQIEGNTYSLLDTESLIKNNIEAKGHKKEEATMILNHKYALTFIFENYDYFKDITLKKIEELHYLITKDLGISKGLRKSSVGIVGTKYKPLSNENQIKEAMEKFIKALASTNNVIEKALIAVLMISYIQPFEDGNKRTGRILANAILYANGFCPLSYRSISDVDYKKAVIIFYENNSLEFFKTLFVSQFKFAVEQYF